MARHTNGCIRRLVKRLAVGWAILLSAACVDVEEPQNAPTSAPQPTKKRRPAAIRVESLPAADGFRVVELVATTPLKDQQSSGTCWSFATTSFIEAEALRLNKGPVSLSAIFYVAPTYLAKAERYISRRGDSYFGNGDLTFSVLDAYDKYGAVPEEVYDGIISGEWQHDHVEMDNLLEAMVKSVGTSGYGRIKPNSWKEAFSGTLRAYLGEPPQHFKYRGRTYTPLTFAQKVVGIDPTSYLEVTSFQHLPYYQMSVLQIPANWGRRAYLNVPLDDFERMINHALEKGFSLAWDGDASEDGFQPDEGVARLSSDEEETRITAPARQRGFESRRTTDDHNMHLIGTALDAAGHHYYVMKNSEGPNQHGGYIYMSKNYLLLKTISVLVHRDALPADLRSKSLER